jgi:hypothetical protein
LGGFLLESVLPPIALRFGGFYLGAIVKDFNKLLDNAKTDDERDAILQEWAEAINAGTWRPLPKIDPNKTIAYRNL